MQMDRLREMTSGSIIGQAKPFAAEMTPRERWRRVFHYQAVDRIPCYEFGYWAELYDEWHEQGLPEEITTERQLDAYFGYDRRVSVPVNVDLNPRFEYKVLEEDARHKVIQDTNGTIAQINKDGSSSIPHFLEFPIKGRDDWERFKERLDPDTPGRLPENVIELAARYRTSKVPVGVNIGSMFGRLRDWMGFERIAMMVYDDPDLIDEMVETMCNLVITTIKPLLNLFEFDYAGGWEDMAFNNGPLISPKMFEQFLVPRYKRIADLLHEHGVDVIWTDCDGNIMSIAGLWLEAGYNCMFPIEVRAGSDPVALRERFGRDMLLLGGYNKMALLEGPEAILAELKRLEPVVAEGGFIPHVDHRTPAGVSLENYCYYVREKKAMLGYPPDEIE
jgi:uroporphyrinogen decarboxylase